MLEKLYVDFEQKEGLSQIAQFVSETCAPSEVMCFIDDYRHVIRDNNWNLPDDVSCTYTDFIQSFYNTHTNYFLNAISFMRNPDVELAIASEQLRGLVGKRSAIGLDAFLKKEIQNIAHLEGADIIQSVLSEPFSSAEYDLYESFYTHSKMFSHELTYKNVDCINEMTDGLTAKILREFCKYSLNDFNKKLTLLDLSTETYNRKKQFKAQAQEERHFFVSEIKDAELLESVKRINELNYLNTNVEVKFSFKGFPGLLHYLVFRDEKDLRGKIHEITRNSCLQRAS